ncbi:MAG: hypothetical protein A2W31_07720 [Planctomycetes bacterium RBG_16_64_10]|nr:MAG: hypothetical protein A2W31_07720 [Planctomycetes bacterium RBG_16_64_10]
MLLMASGPTSFKRHELADFTAGYQVAVVDVNGDGKPDVIALSTSANRVDWYENPSWRQRPIARTEYNIDVAARDVDGDGRPELALASGFYFADGNRGGNIDLLRQPTDLDQGSVWPSHSIAVDPVVHRLRWGDLDGDGRVELVHAPIFGPGSKGPADSRPAHLWAFRMPREPAAEPWNAWKIDETLSVLHGLHVADLDGDGRDEILTASFEGIHRFDFAGAVATGKWHKARIAAGVPPADAAPGSPRGSSEAVPGRFGPRRPFIAAIEPWHGNQVVVYTAPEADGPWQRRVLDETLAEGHALLVADFDGDGADEIVAGWRAGQGGLALYDPLDQSGDRFARVLIDDNLPIDGAAVGDVNLDGQPDIVAASGRANQIVWYENRTR